MDSHIYREPRKIGAIGFIAAMLVMLILAGIIISRGNTGGKPITNVRMQMIFDSNTGNLLTTTYP